MDVIQEINLIAVNPAIRNGRPYIIDTTITVHDVAIAKLYHDRDADGIAEWYGLTLPQVYAALSYYYDHKSTVDEQVCEQIQRAETLQKQRVGNQRSLLS